MALLPAKEGSHTFNKDLTPFSLKRKTGDGSSNGKATFTVSQFRTQNNIHVSGNFQVLFPITQVTKYQY